MDFAGGTPVHITSGASVAAFHIFYDLDSPESRQGLRDRLRNFFVAIPQHIKSFFRILKQSMKSPGTFGLPVQPQAPGHEMADLRRPRPNRDHAFASWPSGHNPPHDVNNVVLGTTLLWIGWLGFNGGSALGGNMRAVSACVSTHVAACAGGACGLLLSWLAAWLKRRSIDSRQEMSIGNISVVQLCDGVIAGLVAITPGAGYVGSLLLLDSDASKLYCLLSLTNIYLCSTGANLECSCLRYCGLCVSIWSQAHNRGTSP